LKIYKICFWLNVQSAHQSLFLDSLDKCENIELEVFYFDKPNTDRLKLGWKANNNFKEYEYQVISLDKTLNELDNWENKIHIVMGYGYSFNKQLVPILIKNHAEWVHWSERYGIVLANKLNFNVFLFSVLRPLFLLTKRPYGKLLQKYALGCFAQGELAKRDFILMGISKSKIKNLFYTSTIDNHIQKVNKNNQITFLYVGQLSIRKGTEDLIRAFAKIDNANCQLLLVGQDTSNGKYKKLIDSLGLSTKIILKGIIPFNQIDEVYSQSDVFVFPSRYDGWGAVLNEALMASLPIISTNQVGAAYHAIKKNKNGFIVKAGHINQLANVMQLYVKNKNLIREHSIYSLKLSREFSPESNVTRFLQAIDEWDIRIKS